MERQIGKECKKKRRWSDREGREKERYMARQVHAERERERRGKERERERKYEQSSE